MEKDKVVEEAFLIEMETLFNPEASIAKDVCAPLSDNLLFYLQQGSDSQAFSYHLTLPCEEDPRRK